jgi:2-polyprenyl-3-methyl-5-hydroxy-6-metoxy-1,4-benzoquinol methylase
MMATNFLKRTYWRLLRLLGFEESSWDMQFNAGIWSRGPQSPHTIDLVQKYAKGGKIVEFGCGEGNLLRSLAEDCYTEFTGYDISKVAIKRAKKFSNKGSARSINFEQCNMAKWGGANSLSLIILEECLYYLPPIEVEHFLTKCVESLSKDGVILVIVHSASKHAVTLDVCRRCCRVIDELQIDKRTYLILGKKNEFPEMKN